MKPVTRQTYHERMLRVLVHIQNHLDEALSLEELARVAHFSPYHFHRIFQGMVGETLMTHVRRLRLERAAMRLKAGDQPVTQIAFEAGYETHEAFTRAFRAMFDASPTEFRQLHQPIEMGPAPSGVHFSPEGLNTFQPQETGGSKMEASIKRLDPMRVAFVRHTGPYHECGQAWQQLCGWAGPKGLFGPQTRMLGLCHDDPQVTPPDKVRYDACMTVDGSVEPEGKVGVQEVAGGDYATALHQGPYENLAQTYAQLCGEWIPAQGREIAGAPSVEVYLNDPNTTPPEQLRTEVHVPLAPK